MTCVRPLSGHRAPGGRVTFSRAEGWPDLRVDVACGQCIGCRLARSRAWALRCVHESKLHEHSSFVTLTYDKEHLPEDGSLSVREWQLFAKALRKAVGPFRFFHAGEYGEQTFRPHYHVLLFGRDFHQDRLPMQNPTGSDPLYRSPTLESVWGKGACPIGDVTFKSAAYVARYCIKKRTGPNAAAAYRRIDLDTAEEYFVRPEYITMSRRPGIGRGWYERFGKEVFPDDEVIHEGRKYRPPKFYDKLLEQEDPEAFATIKARRVEKAKKTQKSVTASRLRAKERIAEQTANRNPRGF